ncbi:MAG: branched-chain amino acid ABC transporter ATP-binding protein/permease [Betaproteobacteria bacterium]|nr:branched-chain amino acid ABC transporter ATP-binding protein/permease [Betaproteobacteria bacterium]
MSKSWAYSRQQLLLALAILLLLAVPALLPSFLIPVAITVFIYASLALGWNIVMGYTGQLSLAQTLFIGAGVYTPALLFINYKISPWLGMWAGALIAVALAVFIGYVCFRYKVKGVYFSLVSIAFSQIGLAFVTTFKVLGGAHELFWPITGAAADFQFSSSAPFYYIGLAMLGAMTFFAYFLRQTRTGYYFFAIRDNEEAAQAIGIDTMKYKIIALALSAFLTSVAGTYWVQYLGVAIAREQMGLGILILLILCALIGGLGTVFGPILGALFVVILGTLLRLYLPMIPGGANVMIYAALLILAILFMPQGIAGLLEKRFTRRGRTAAASETRPSIATVASSAAFLPAKKTSTSPLLKVDQLQKNFGGLRAVSDLSFQINPGEIVGLIGPNGAGKTTLFNLVSGFFPPASGEIVFDGKKLNGLRPDEICRLGLVRTFQTANPFSNLTVVDNVMLGAFVHCQKLSPAKEKAMHILDAVGMAHRASVPAKDLTFAEQRRLEFARALATDPALILLDESMAGLTPTETKQAIDLILRCRESGITFLIVEHVMPVIMTLAERVIVMNLGENMAQGTPQEIARNRQVIEAYLGEEALVA